MLSMSFQSLFIAHLKLLTPITSLSRHDNSMDRSKLCRLTSSTNRTPGTISALPSSRHSATLVLIWSRTSDFISPVSPVKGGGADSNQVTVKWT